jgi:hypothetical protein
MDASKLVKGKRIEVSGRKAVVEAHAMGPNMRRDAKSKVSYRLIKIPDAEILDKQPEEWLEVAWRLGQNEFQRQCNCRSLMVGDTIWVMRRQVDGHVDWVRGTVGKLGFEDVVAGDGEAE